MRSISEEHFAEQGEHFAEQGRLRSISEDKLFAQQANSLRSRDDQDGLDYDTSLGDEEGELFEIDAFDQDIDFLNDGTNFFNDNQERDFIEQIKNFFDRDAEDREEDWHEVSAHPRYH